MNELLYLGFFLIYSIMILVLGKHGFDKTDHLKGYFLAGRNLSLFSSIASFGATWFSTASILGLPGLIYENGLSVIWTTAFAWLLGAIGLLFISSKLYTYEIVTVPEFFYVRYQSKLLQVAMGIILVISYMLYIVIQIRGFGIVVSEMLEIPYSISIFLIYLFVLYTTFGGLHSVARTDIFHFLLIIIGTTFGAVFIVKEIGGLTHLFQIVSDYEKENIISQSYMNFFPNHGFSFWTLLSAFFTLGLGVAVNPQYIVRILSAKSKQVALKMIVLGFIFFACIYILIFIIGIGSKVLEPNIHMDNSDEIYPYVISYLLQTPWKGLILVSVVAAAISTANSQLLIMASSFVYDINRPLRRKQISDQKKLSWTRRMIFLFATISLFIAFTSQKGMVTFSGNIWGGLRSLYFSLYMAGSLLIEIGKAPFGPCLAELLHIVFHFFSYQVRYNILITRYYLL
ncbi:sodium:solute symporter [Bacillus manliponensis]|uniref:sodium:solute symporter family protein n=1 Tax=Bacillus manliponensis TaxID=574376 RepID=UPI003513D5DD